MRKASLYHCRGEASNSPSLSKLYGHYLSQPTRAVLWTLAMKGHFPHKKGSSSDGGAYDFQRLSPIFGECDTDAFYAMFPQGTLPAAIFASSSSSADIDEGSGGASPASSHPPLHLTEVGALLPYLCRINGWSELYPSASSTSLPSASSSMPESRSSCLQRKAIIDQWLHWYHSNLRRVCFYNFWLPWQSEFLNLTGSNDDKNNSGTTSQLTSTFYDPFSCEDPSNVIGGGDYPGVVVNKDLLWCLKHMNYNSGINPSTSSSCSTRRQGQGEWIVPDSQGPTIADIVLYCELDQLDLAILPHISSSSSASKGSTTPPMSFRDLYLRGGDDGQPPLQHLENWMDRMAQLPEHDSVRSTLKKMSAQFLKLREQKQ